MSATTSSGSLLPPAAPSAEDYGAFLYWPDNLVWSNQLNRLIGYVSLGAADFSEIWSVAHTLPVGDTQAWEDGFARLAARLDTEAVTATRHGHILTARAKWLRASTYYRFAGQLSAFTGTPGPSVDASVRCFRAATDNGDPVLEQVNVPFRDQALAGYLIHARGITTPAPAVIVSGGIDAFAEEMYFKIGRVLADRGYVVLLLDGPGQGESARRGITGRHPYEAACAAAVDYLTARADVDGTRLAMLGQSLGGYYATRAAAFEPRLATAVIWGATANFYPEVGTHLTADSPLMGQLGQMQRYFDVTGADAVREALRDMTLNGVCEKITCPTLILHGELDIQIPVEAAVWTRDHITNAPTRLVIVPAGQPGATHCQLDAPLVAQHIICDYLDEVLERR